MNPRTSINSLFVGKPRAPGESTCSHALTIVLVGGLELYSKPAGERKSQGGQRTEGKEIEVERVPVVTGMGQSTKREG